MTKIDIIGLGAILGVGVFSYMVANKDHIKKNKDPILSALIIVMASIVATTFLTSCRTTSHRQEYMMRELHTAFDSAMEASLQRYALQGKTFTYENEIFVDSLIEKEYTDSTGAKVKEKIHLRSKNAKADTNTSVSQEASSENTTKKHSASNTNIQSKEEDKTKSESSSWTNSFPLALSIVFVIALMLIIIDRLAKRNRGS